MRQDLSLKVELTNSVRMAVSNTLALCSQSGSTDRQHQAWIFVVVLGFQTHVFVFA